MGSNRRIQSDLDPDTHLMSLLQVYQPRKIFLLSAIELPAVRDYQNASGSEVVTLNPAEKGFTAESLTSQPPVDLAIVVNVGATFPKKAAQSVIGTIRNMVAPKIAAYECLTTSVPENDWFALGFKQLATFLSVANPTADKPLAFCQLAYGYDLGSYNHKREWNNPKYWANPEMWDKR